MTTSWDEASKCPKDDTQGEVVREEAQRDGSKMITLTCPNERCSWYGTNFLVKVNPDGSIPNPITKRPKQYHAIPNDHGRTEEVLQRALQQMRQPGGGEVTR